MSSSPLALPKPLSVDEWEALLLRRRGGDPGRTWASVPEAADLLYVSKETVRNWCRAGVLAHARVNRQRAYRIPMRALAEHLVGQAVSPL
jgi:excisionase family DNA binding protein